WESAGIRSWPSLDGIRPGLRRGRPHHTRGSPGKGPALEIAARVGMIAPECRPAGGRGPAGKHLVVPAHGIRFPEGLQAARKLRPRWWALGTAAVCNARLGYQ